MLERATQKGTSDIVFSCHQSPEFKDDPASSRQRIAQLTRAQRISGMGSQALESERNGEISKGSMHHDPTLSRLATFATE